MRLLIGLVGVAMGGYGGWQLAGLGWSDLGAVLLWLGVSVLVHDAVFAPTTVGLTALGTSLVPHAARRKLTLALVVLVTVTVTAIPVLGGWGRHADNPTVLDRDYVTGWWLFAGLVLAGTLVWAWLPRIIHRRRGDR